MRSRSGWQNNRVWERGCGLDRTVVEGVRFDETADTIVVSARPDARARSRCGQCGRRSPGYDSGDGRRRWRLSTPAPPECLLRPTPSESNVVPMAQQSPRFHGRDTTWATPATSTRWRRGLLSALRRVRPVNCCGWRGGRSGRSSPGSTTMLKRGLTVLRGCVGSGSMRSLTNGPVEYFV